MNGQELRVALRQGYGRTARRRFAVLCALALCGSVFLAAPAAFSQDDVLRLTGQAFAAPQRPAVSFPHAAHAQTLDCTACHHLYEKGKNVWEPGMETSCAACHKADDTGRLGLRRAWHGLCIGCHEQSAARFPRAPVMCGQCHRESSGVATAGAAS